MKKIITVFVLVVAFAFTTQAQQKVEKASVEKMLTKMTKDLNLTEEQLLKIKPLLEAQMEERTILLAKRKAMQDSGEKPSKEARKKMQEDRVAAQKTMHKNMAAILDNDQFEKFEALAKERKEKAKKKKEMN